MWDSIISTALVWSLSPCRPHRCCPHPSPRPPPCRQLYRKLGAKLVVGMPFKDIATSGEVQQLPSVCC